MNTKSLEVLKCYFSSLILKLHIICVLTRLGHKSMSCPVQPVMKLLTTHGYVCTALWWGEPSLCPSALEIHKRGASWRVILMNAQGFFTECKCEEAKIHLDFKSPLESMRGGSMSICYLDMTLSLHKKKDRVLTLYLGCVCAHAYVCVFSHLLLYIHNEY